MAFKSAPWLLLLQQGERCDWRTQNCPDWGKPFRTRFRRSCLCRRTKCPLGKRSWCCGETPWPGPSWRTTTTTTTTTATTNRRRPPPRMTIRRLRNRRRESPAAAFRRQMSLSLSLPPHQGYAPWRTGVATGGSLSRRRSSRATGSGTRRRKGKRGRRRRRRRRLGPGQLLLEPLHPWSSGSGGRRRSALNLSSAAAAAAEGGHHLSEEGGWSAPAPVPAPTPAPALATTFPLKAKKKKKKKKTPVLEDTIIIIVAIVVGSNNKSHQDDDRSHLRPKFLYLRLVLQMNAWLSPTTAVTHNINILRCFSRPRRRTKGLFIIPMIIIVNDGQF